MTISYEEKAKLILKLCYCDEYHKKKATVVTIAFLNRLLALIIFCLQN